MPRVPAAYAEARKAEIMRAARHVFARSGTNAATMHDIAAEAGLSTGALYGYFKSKDEIVRAIRQENRDRYTSAAFGEALHGVTELRTALPRMADAFFDVFRSPDAVDEARMAVGLYGEAAFAGQLRSRVRRDFEAVINRNEQLWLDACRRGEVAADVDPRSMALIMLVLREGLAVVLSLGIDVDMDRYVDHMHSILASKILPSAKAGGSKEKERES